MSNIADKLKNHRSDANDTTASKGKRGKYLRGALYSLFPPVLAVLCSVFLYLAIDGFVRLALVVALLFMLVLFAKVLNPLSLKLAGILSCPLLWLVRPFARHIESKREKTSPKREKVTYSAI